MTDKRFKTLKMVALGLAILTALFILTSSTSFAGNESLEQIGERIYLTGVGPDGEPVEATVQGDLTVLGTEITCVSCHMRAGLGSLEGGVITTPTAGSRLYVPYTDISELPMVTLGRIRKLSMAPPPRPAYTPEGVALAIRTGIDPAGRELDPIMPRYNIDGMAMDALLAYLGKLSRDVSPGIDHDKMHLATVVTPDVSDADREDMLWELNDFLRSRNQLKRYTDRARRSGDSSRLKMLAKDLDLEALKELVLHVWELKGDQSTWRSQLEDYYKKQPVFLMLGGMSNGSWEVIHRYCEENRIPSILPNTDFVPDIQKDWYTVYISRGYRAEGETAARYLLKVAKLSKDSKILQIYKDTLAGAYLADGFSAEWAKTRGSTPVNVKLGAGDPLDPAAIKAIVEREKPDALMLWVDKAGYPALDAISAMENRPGATMLSSTLLLDEMWDMPENPRSYALFTFPYKLQEEKPLSTPGASSRDSLPQPPFHEREVSVRARAAGKLFTDVLANIRGNLYRDYILDIVDMMGQSTFAPNAMNSMMGLTVGPDYGRLSFGPNQRVASKGCYIVQLSPKGETPLLQKRSEWIIH